MAAGPNLCYADGFRQSYWQPLDELLLAYSKQDPLPQAKLAVPVSVAQWDAMQTCLPKTSPKHQQLAISSTLPFTSYYESTITPTPLYSKIGGHHNSAYVMFSFGTT